MNYLIRSTLLVIICLTEIIFSQAVHNQSMFGSILNNQKMGASIVQKPDWINKENVTNVETILEKTILPDQYTVGPGDQFAINIISSDGVFNYILEVSPTGELLVPLIGLIKIDQLSLKSAIEQIKILTNSKYENAKLEIILFKIRNFKIHVSGAVETSGFVVVSAIDRLGDVIKKSGGFLQLAKEYNIEIIHYDGTSDYFNYLEYIRKGDMDQNPIIRTGDRVNIPYGKIASESVVVSGAVKKIGYDIIEPGETLFQFMKRNIKFQDNALLNKIYISRMNNEVHEINSTEFNQYILVPGDEINIPEELAVFVTGFVKNPGRYKYFIGFSVEDYLGLAGGNLKTGNQDKVKIQHIDDTFSIGVHQPVEKGDIIYVPQRNLNKLVGEQSFLQILSSLSAVALSYIAATR